MCGRGSLRLRSRSWPARHGAAVLISGRRTAAELSGTIFYLYNFKIRVGGLPSSPLLPSPTHLPSSIRLHEIKRASVVRLLSFRELLDPYAFHLHTHVFNMNPDLQQYRSNSGRTKSCRQPIPSPSPPPSPPPPHAPLPLLPPRAPPPPRPPLPLGPAHPSLPVAHPHAPRGCNLRRHSRQ